MAHSARGPHHVVDPDIRLGGNLMFPNILHLFLCWRGAKVYSQTG